MRIVFAGTPDFAAIHLQSLLNHNLKPIAVYSQPDRASGRGYKLQASPVKQLAIKNDIACYQPLNFKSSQDIKQLAELKPDIMIVVAYGLILPKEVLQIPRYGCWNVHASLLPRWRGAAPIIRAIEAGDSKTGICIMQMDEGLDTGNVLLSESCIIHPHTTGESLHNELANLGGQALIAALTKLNHLQPIPQPNDGVTYAHKISKEDSVINWHQNAEIIERKIRALYPKPATITKLNDQPFKIIAAQLIDLQGEAGTILKITSKELVIACDKDALKILKAQLPGGKVLDFAQIYAGNSHLFKLGDKLG